MSEQALHELRSDPGDVADKPVENSLQEDCLFPKSYEKNIIMSDNNSEEKHFVDGNTDPNSEIATKSENAEIVLEGKLNVSSENQVVYKERKRNLRQICFYFTKQGYCRYGMNCRYLHPKRANNAHFQKEKYASRSNESDTRPFKRKMNPRVKEDAKAEDGDGNVMPKDNKSKRDTNLYDPPNYRNSHIDTTSKGRLNSRGNFNSKPFGSQYNTDSKGTHQRSLVYYNSERRPQRLYDAQKQANDAKICYFFKQGYCRRGDECRFLHPIDVGKQNLKDLKPSAEKHSSSTVGTACEQSNAPERKVTKPYSKRIIPTSRQALTLKDLSDSDLKDLRKTEMQQLKKRFTDCKVVVRDTEDVFQMGFFPSDPDWSFDVQSVMIEMVFSKLYPCEACHIEVLNKHVDLPPLLVKFLNKSIAEWLTERYQASESAGKVELISRPFLRWFDRNLEELFIIGLRKVKQHIEAEAGGIEFVPFEDLQSATGGKDISPTGVEESYTDNEYFVNSQAVEGSGCEADGESESSIAFENSEKENVAPDSPSKEVSSAIAKEESSVRKMHENKQSTPKLGTEAKLLDLELTENASAMICQKVVITLQCTRCKTRHEMNSSARKCNTLNCTKCHQEMQMTFQPAILHKFSAVMGNFHFHNCHAVDIPLMQCVFKVDCLACSKQVSLSGIHFGQPRITFCLFCHNKLSIFTSSVKFHHLQPASFSGTAGHRLTVEKKEKNIKATGICEGSSLPDYGTCKHYKKSYRWLRFPCCGKSYPCDVCHDEKADHEMKFANRMICGFCAKEQPYNSDRPCISCALSMTKKSGPHWEGGRGCRDRIKMSRDDRQKYAGVSKTVSRRSQGLKPYKGK